MPISKRLKKNLRYTFFGLFVILCLLLISFFLKREAILKTAINRVIFKAKSTYDLNIKIREAKFIGINTVQFKDITVIPENKDSLAKFESVTISINTLPLLLGHIKIGNFMVSNAKITLTKKDTISNYDFLFKKNNKKDSTKTKLNIAELANKLLRQALDKVPDNMRINNFLIKFDQDTTHINLFTPSAIIEDGEIKSTIVLNNKEAIWHLNGTLNPSEDEFDIRFFADKNKVVFPYLDKKYGLKLSFDTLRFAMQSAQKAGDNFEVEGLWGIKNLLINHSKISAQNVIVKDAKLNIKLIAGEDFVSIDSSSTIYSGKAFIHPYIKYSLAPNKIIALKLHANMQPAQEIFNAFPIGLFESLEGIKVAGDLEYDLNFYLDTKHPEKVIFDSNLDADRNFKILAFGKTNLRKINGSFVYTPFELGKPVRDINVSPENPNFTPINQISPYLRNALLTSEDPSFYSHKGFVEESIRQSIATNYKAKSFKRGGSTISMQLVKNIYLSRQKTISRKIEEMLIVWLLENQHLSTKNRMYEVYLNIIEWGRNIYGIGEASRYYFGKTPSELSLGEAIYLAHIVPKPKASMYAWLPDGSLKPYLHGYFNLIGRLMANRGYTTPDSSAYGFYGVRLRDALIQQIAPVENTAPDSIWNEEDIEESFTLFKAQPKDTVNKKTNIFNRIFGPKIDSTSKSAKEIRRDRREKRREKLLQN